MNCRMPRVVREMVRAAWPKQSKGVAVATPVHTTKAAVLGYTRALAVEEAPHGIRVNAVCPGGTITPYHVARAAAQGVSEAELRKSRAGDNLLGRWAEPEEIAHPILFLSCAESSFITGATLMVDAGKSIL